MGLWICPQCRSSVPFKFHSYSLNSQKKRLITLATKNLKFPQLLLLYHYSLRVPSVSLSYIRFLCKNRSFSLPGKSLRIQPTNLFWHKNFCQEIKATLHGLTHKRSVAVSPLTRILIEKSYGHIIGERDRKKKTGSFCVFIFFCTIPQLFSLSGSKLREVEI